MLFKAVAGWVTANYFLNILKIKNMKQKFFFAGLILLFAACSKESINVVDNAQTEETTTAPVRVHVSNFAVEMGDFPAATRTAQNVGNYDGVKAITLAFYKGETEVYKHEQVRGQLEEGETFGEFSTTLPLGSYKMVVIARGLGDGDVFTLTSPTEAAYTGNSRETFAYTQEVNITNGDAVDLNATLNRIIAMLGVISSDGRTAEATNVRMTFSAGGKSFDPTTGLAIVNTGFAITAPISTAVGAVTSSGTYVFLASNEQTMDVTIETLDSEGNAIFSKTVQNVPFKRNRRTILTGAMYTNDAVSSSFKLETEWLANYPVNF